MGGDFFSSFFGVGVIFENANSPPHSLEDKTVCVVAVGRDGEASKNLEVEDLHRVASGRRSSDSTALRRRRPASRSRSRSRTAGGELLLWEGRGWI